MIIYHYDRITKEFLGSSEARLDPKETEIQGKEVYLIPTYTTIIEPLTLDIDEVAVFESDNWVAKEDHRGKTVFDIATAEDMVINQIGPMPDGFTLEIPMDSFALWNGTAWVIDTNKKAKAFREEMIQKEVREAAIKSLISKGKLPKGYRDRDRK